MASDSEFGGRSGSTAFAETLPKDQKIAEPDGTAAVQMEACVKPCATVTQPPRALMSDAASGNPSRRCSIREWRSAPTRFPPGHAWERPGKAGIPVATSAGASLP